MPIREVMRSRWGIVTTVVATFAVGGGIAYTQSGQGNPDSSPPSLFITAPLAGATVSGAAVTVSAICGDNVGCAGVQFRLDGANLGAEDTAAPFAISWDSTASSNGTHTIYAVARDAAGHATNSRSETVTVSNSAPTADVYVAQTSAGANDGTSCANAKAYTFFNDASQWGAGKTIAPGKTVGLCGTITTSLIAQGSGSAGAPITILWGSGAKLSQPACPPTGCFNTNSQTYLTLDGGVNGIVESTDNGSILGSQSISRGIVAMPCNNCTFTNLTIQNIYVHAGTGDEIDHTQMNAIKFRGLHITISNNTIHDAGFALQNPMSAGDGDVHVTGNTIYHADHGYVPTGVNGSSLGGSLWYDHNHFYDPSNWGTSQTVSITIGSPAVFTCVTPSSCDYKVNQIVCLQNNGDTLPTGLSFFTSTCNGGPFYYVIAAGLTASSFEVSTTSGGSAVNTTGSQSGTHIANTNAYHHDGIHCYTGGTTGMHIPNFYIYDNDFDGAWVTNTTASVFLEGPAAGTACNDATSNIWVFNNRTTLDVAASNDVYTVANGVAVVVNNSLSKPDPLATNTTCLGNGPSIATYKNNIIGGCNQLIHGDFATATADYNFYYHCSGSFNCFFIKSGGSTIYDGSVFSAYQSATGLDAHGGANIASTTAGTLGQGGGANLTSMCTGDLVPLCSTIDGTARPTSGAWNAGAN